MEDQLLAMHAASALQEVKSALWDTMGWNLYLTLSRSIACSEEQKLAVWKTTIDGQHAGWTYKYRLYVKAGGIHANFSAEEEKARNEQAFTNDMRAWDAIRIQRIERMDGIFKFFTTDSDVFELDVGSIYSQTDFRKAVTMGTSKILPAIKKESFERFILSLSIIQIENIGISTLEKVEESLETLSRRLKDNQLGTEQEAIDAVESRGAALHNNHLYFKIQTILNDLWRESKSINTTKLVSALRDLGAETIKHRKFNFWRYDLGTRATEESI
jgi:hypothetical protein